jgi:hypothetical protein
MISRETSYKAGFFGAKFSGFVFYSLKSSQNGVKFHRNFFDYFIFFVSLTFSLYNLVFGNQDLKIEVKSQIMDIGMMILFQLSLVSIVLTKGINMFGAPEAFNMMKILVEIDKKV